MRKLFLPLTLILPLILAVMAPARVRAGGAQPLLITSTATSQSSAYIDNGVTMIAFTELADRLGLQQDIRIRSGSSSLFIGDFVQTLPVPVSEKNGQLFVPLKAVASLLSCSDVRYDPLRNTVIFTPGPLKTSAEVTGAMKKVRNVHLFDLNKQRTSSNILSDIDLLTDQYGGLIEKIPFGTSGNGQPLTAVKVGLPSESPKVRVLIVAGIHAREDFSVMLAMNQIEQLAYNYYEDGIWGGKDIATLLKQVDFWFVPTLNPDGLDIVRQGIRAQPNAAYLSKLKIPGGSTATWKANGRGVDLNANFDDGNWKVKWIPGLSSRTPAAEGYKGSAPFSEAESSALAALCNKVQFDMALSYHTAGELFYWADTDTHAIFKGTDNDIVNALHGVSGYAIHGVSTDPSVFGCGFENWFKKTYHRFAMCVELGPMRDAWLQYDSSNFESLVWYKTRHLVTELGFQALKVQQVRYDVYQGGRWLQSFYSRQDALNYGKMWENARIYQDHQLTATLN